MKQVFPHPFQRLHLPIKGRTLGYKNFTILTSCKVCHRNPSAKITLSVDLCVCAWYWSLNPKGENFFTGMIECEYCIRQTFLKHPHVPALSRLAINSAVKQRNARWFMLYIGPAELIPVSSMNAIKTAKAWCSDICGSCKLIAWGSDPISCFQDLSRLSGLQFSRPL